MGRPVPHFRYRLRFFEVGTAIPLKTYSDENLTKINPIAVVVDSTEALRDGRPANSVCPPIFLPLKKGESYTVEMLGTGTCIIARQTLTV